MLQEIHLVVDQIIQPFTSWDNTQGVTLALGLFLATLHAILTANCCGRFAMPALACGCPRAGGWTT
ncbi:MAG: hypothetical protein NTY19_21870 [Planctomycetota bacterium]|nr:hypothetical protein [Planctomycetota bacterium]